MRLYLRTVVGVAVILILFIIFTYQATHLHREAKLRIKKDQEKAWSRERNSVENHPLGNSKKSGVQIVLGAPESQHGAGNIGRNTRSHGPRSVGSAKGALPERHKNSLKEIVKKYPLFQPAEEVEFPTKEGVESRIPNIIHQIYTNLTIVANYSKYIKTFTENNPKWEYRFWSCESGRRLIAERHPYLLSTFDNFAANNIKRIDMIKYVVLYEFGGLYSDLDVKNYRSLDIVTKKFACIIPTEPFEHPSLLVKRTLLLNTAILICRPKHPFFQAVLKRLQGIKPDAYPVNNTGSQFLTIRYMEYMNLTKHDLTKPTKNHTSNAPYFYKGTLDEEDDDGIYIPNSQYFNDKVDPGILRTDGNTIPCQDFMSLKDYDNLLLLPPIMVRGCAEFESRRKIRESKNYTFTEHFWHHLWLASRSWLARVETRYIKDIVPNVVLY